MEDRKSTRLNSKAGYPVIWKNKEAQPKLAFIGCPHLSFAQLVDFLTLWETNVEEEFA